MEYGDLGTGESAQRLVEKEKKSDRLLVFFLDINVDSILIVIQIQNQNLSGNATVQIVLSPVIGVEGVLTGELDHGQGVLPLVRVACREDK